MSAGALFSCLPASSLVCFPAHCLHHKHHYLCPHHRPPTDYLSAGYKQGNAPLPDTSTVTRNVTDFRRPGMSDTDMLLAALKWAHRQPEGPSECQQVAALCGGGQRLKGPGLEPGPEQALLAATGPVALHAACNSSRAPALSSWQLSVDGVSNALSDHHLDKYAGPCCAMLCLHLQSTSCWACQLAP